MAIAQSRARSRKEPKAQLAAERAATRCKASTLAATAPSSIRARWPGSIPATVATVRRRRPWSSRLERSSAPIARRVSMLRRSARSWTFVRSPMLSGSQHHGASAATYPGLSPGPPPNVASGSTNRWFSAAAAVGWAGGFRLDPVSLTPGQQRARTVPSRDSRRALPARLLSAGQRRRRPRTRVGWTHRGRGHVGAPRALPARLLSAGQRRRRGWLGDR